MKRWSIFPTVFGHVIKGLIRHQSLVIIFHVNAVNTYLQIFTPEPFNLYNTVTLLYFLHRGSSQSQSDHQR